MTADTTDKTITGGDDAATAAEVAEATADQTTDAGKGTEVAKEGDQAETKETTTDAPVVPEEYDLSLEGDLAEPGVREGLEGAFRKAGMTQDAASEFVGDFMPKLLQHQKAKAESWKSGLRETLEADPEFIGKDGKGFDASAELRDKAIKAVPGGEQLHKWLSESGLINMPGLAKAFRFFGEHMKDDAVLPGSGRGNPKPRGENIGFDEAADVLYG